ncbi:MAG TPA: HisA/HisF-related TIM barrel protein [Pirellulales bacterium]|jgi:phosphoribosylformimino-5-aminoimidazole carboxamide ribotide isomerase|nr:HisA/HisF-related TIM barrel protein [Pirellulales bacterium]
MRILPVIDLLQGIVVRGVGGRRETYKPIQSCLAPDASPASIADGLARANFSAVYVADLDAIQGGEPSWRIYNLLLARNLELWIDCGLRNAEHAGPLLRYQTAGRRMHSVIAGLETLESPTALADLVECVGAERLVFSLDMDAGSPRIGSQAWAGLSAFQIACVALRAGVRRFILLDLRAIGIGQGPVTLPLCRAMRSLADDLEIADLELTSGGGVRSWQDIRAFDRAGCDAILVASALHDGRLDPAAAARARLSI